MFTSHGVGLLKLTVVIPLIRETFARLSLDGRLVKQDSSRVILSAPHGLENLEHTFDLVFQVIIYSFLLNVQNEQHVRCKLRRLKLACISPLLIAHSLQPQEDRQEK